VIAEVDGLLEQFEFGKACETLYHFAWDEFCDWYLELAKVPLASGDETAAARTRAVLGFVLDQMLRLLHPVMPFVTDELWCALTGEDSVMVAAWPRFEFADAVAEAEIGSLMRLVTEIRQFRSGQGLRPGQRVPARLVGLEATPLRAHEESIRALLRLTVPERTGPAPTVPEHAGPAPTVPEHAGPEHQDGFAASASLLAQGVTVELDLAGTVDVAAERKRLDRDLAAARKEARSMTAKLGNEAFTAKAPAEVIEKSRARLATAEADIARLESRLAALLSPGGRPREGSRATTGTATWVAAVG
jgi:valyl-tRNA synthetase